MFVCVCVCVCARAFSAWLQDEVGREAKEDEEEGEEVVEERRRRRRSKCLHIRECGVERAGAAPVVYCDTFH